MYVSACACVSVNLSVYLHALLLTVIPASVFVHIVSLLPSCVYVPELMTEKPQPSFAWAETPGRLAEQRDFVWGDIVPTWAVGLTGCLYKLSSVAAGFACQQILFCSLIPRRDASCSRILPPSPSFTLVFASSAGGSMCLCVGGLKSVFILDFNVFVVHAVPLWPAPAYPLTLLCVVV